MKNQVTLFLMSQKGLKVLETLGKEFSDIIDFVVIGRDLNVQNDYYDEICQACNELGIKFYDRKDSFQVESSYAIAISWRWLINLTDSKLIIFHDSLLPKYRGFNPLVTCLINGETTIGVSAIFATQEYDRGDIIYQSASSIYYPQKIENAIDIVANNYVDLARKLLTDIVDGQTLIGEKQDESQASYSLWRDEEDYLIDWTNSAAEISRFIDSVGFPYSGASTFINNKLVRILESEEINDVVIENRTPGKVIFIQDSNPVIVCGKGLLKILSMIDDETGDNLLPLKNFRVRMTNSKSN